MSREPCSFCKKSVSTTGIPNRKQGVWLSDWDLEILDRLMANGRLASVHDFHRILGIDARILVFCDTCIDHFRKPRRVGEGRNPNVTP